MLLVLQALVPVITLTLPPKACLARAAPAVRAPALVPEARLVRVPAVSVRVFLVPVADEAVRAAQESVRLALVHLVALAPAANAKAADLVRTLA